MANSGDRPVLTTVEINWGDLLPRLLALARWRLACSAVAGAQPSVGPEDLVQDALIDVLSGNRAWDPEKTTLFTAACLIIRSKISHIAKANHGRERVSLTDEGVSQSIQAAPDLQTHSAETAFWTLHQMRESQDFVLAFHDSLADEGQLQAIVAAIVVDDCAKPAEIASATGIPTKEIYNKMKTLRRRLIAFAKTWKESEQRGA